MSRVRKIRLKTSTITIPVEPEWLTAKQNAVLVVSLMKQILFLRGQLPSLYDALLAEEQHDNLASTQAANGRPLGSKRRLGRDQRRQAKFIASAEELFSSLTSNSSIIFSSAEGATTSVFLLLGPSTSAPREVYELVFPPAASSFTSTEDENRHRDENQDENSQNRLEPVLQARCRQIMREYMTQAFDLPEGTAPDRRCKIFLLASGHGSETPPSFKLRRDFQLKKGIHTRIVLQQDSFDNDTPYEHPKQAWIQSTVKLQGIVQPLKSG